MCRGFTLQCFHSTIVCSVHIDKISDIIIIIVLLKYYYAYTEGELENLSNTDNIDGAVRCSTH